MPFLLLAALALQAPPPAASLSPGEQQRAAMEQQRAAVRQQADAVGARLKPWGNLLVESGPGFESTAAAAACEPLADDAAAPLIDAASKEQSVDAKLLRAVIEQESAFRPCALSPKGAQGLMQLMPATAETFHVADPFDPKENIAAGAKFLKQLLEKYGGDVSKALAAYNAGPNTEDAARIPETKAYVDAVLTKMGIKRTDQPSIRTPKPIEN